MATVELELDDDLIELLQRSQRPVPTAARELIILELYRQGCISSGRAATLLGMQRDELIRYGSSVSIPFFDMTGEEWDVESARSREL